MRCEDEEDAKHVDDPGEGVEKVDLPGGVLRNEEVEQGHRDRVTAEHVVSTCAHALGRNK